VLSAALDIFPKHSLYFCIIDIKYFALHFEEVRKKAAIAHLTFHEADSRSRNGSFINIESVILFFFITRSRALFQVKNFHNNYRGERWQAVFFFPSLENKEILGTVYSKVTVCFSSLVNNFYRRFYPFFVMFYWANRSCDLIFPWAANNTS